MQKINLTNNTKNNPILEKITTWTSYIWRENLITIDNMLSIVSEEKPTPNNNLSWSMTKFNNQKWQCWIQIAKHKHNVQSQMVITLNLNIKWQFFPMVSRTSKFKKRRDGKFFLIILKNILQVGRYLIKIIKRSIFNKKFS